MTTLNVPVIKVHQNIGDLYIGVMKARDLYELHSVDRLRLESLKVPKYAGYQRALDEKRVSDIRDYLETPRSTFPNAIILSIDSEFIEDWQDGNGQADLSVMKIKSEGSAVTVIDGQHRAAALDGAPEHFSVIVTIFVDLDILRCAEIFAKINSTQKAVNPSIAYQLFGYADDRSPQKTAHEIADVLNSTDGSPFFGRLKMMGTKDEWSSGTLSQATFCKELMKLYTTNPTGDQNQLLRGEELEPDSRLPLRRFFLEKKDKVILSIVWRFFFQVAKTWPEQWQDNGGTSILTKTTGYAALIQVLRKRLLAITVHEVLGDPGLAEVLTGIKTHFEGAEMRFIRTNYPAGNQGVIKLRDELLTKLSLA